MVIGDNFAVKSFNHTFGSSPSDFVNLRTSGGCSLNPLSTLKRWITTTIGTVLSLRNVGSN